MKIQGMLEKQLLHEKKRKNIKQMEKSIIKDEHCKVSKLLNNSTVSKFVTKIWNKINNSSSSKYSVNKHIRFKTSLLKSDLRDYSNAYIVVKETITVVGDKNAKKKKGKK